MVIFHGYVNVYQRVSKEITYYECEHPKNQV